MNWRSLLTNSSVLATVTILAVCNLIGLLVTNDTRMVALFIIIGVLVRSFNKNMVLVLGIPLLLVNLLSLQNAGGIEGMTTASATGASSDENGRDRTNKRQDRRHNGKRNRGLDQKTSQRLTMTPLSVVGADGDDVVPSDNADEASEPQGFVSGNAKGQSHSIDYASTIEDAYDQLNSVLGGDGIKRLTNDTQSLMKQQMQLAEAMKGMTPVIKSIAPMVENLKGMMNQMGDSKDSLQSVMASMPGAK